MNNKERSISKVENLVLVAHPDDAIVFCGGMLISSHKKGNTNHVISLTGGDNDSLKKQSLAAYKKVGADSTIFGLSNLGEAHLSGQGLIEAMTYLTRFRPKRIFTHWSQDCHPSHVATSSFSQSLATKLKILTGGIYPEEIWHMDTYYSWGLNSTAFSPTSFIDVSGSWDGKISSMEEFTDYKEELIKMTTSMARVHGGRCGVTHAEGFLRASQISPLCGSQAPEDIF